MPSVFQFDLSLNNFHLSPTTGVYSSSIYAFQGAGGYSISHDFQPIQRLPQTQVNIFDTTGSVQIALPAGLLNAKLGLVKSSRDVSGGFIYDSVDSCGNYYDTSNNMLRNDSITLSATEFSQNVPSVNSIISVGNLATIYADFANYVSAYFNVSLASSSNGFATLFVNDYGFNPNGGVFDASALYHVITGDGVIDASNHSGITQLTGSITISNITKLLRYAVDVNPFGNRDSVNGTTAMDISCASNYGVSDGFLAGDLIFVPNNGFSLQLNTNINYMKTINNYIQNNPNQTSIATYADSSLNGISGASEFHSTSIQTTSYLGRRMSAPLLIRLVDTPVYVSMTKPTSNISVGDISVNLLSYANITIGSTIVFIGPDGVTETRTVVGFGSVVLDLPLTNTYPASKTMVKTQQPNKLIQTFNPPIASALSTNTGSVTLGISGKHKYVKIYRNGTLIQDNYTGNSFVDNTAPASQDTYVVVPYDVYGKRGQSYKTTIDVPYNCTITNVTTPSVNPTSISFTIAGVYSKYRISNGIASDVSLSNTYVFSKLNPRTAYSFSITPYNNLNTTGTVYNINKTTSYDASINSFTVTSRTNSSVIFAIGGTNYDNYSISNGTSTRTGLTTSSYTFDLLSSNTTYTFTITPYNNYSQAGLGKSVQTTTTYTASISSFTVSSTAETSIIFSISGSYATFSISNGSTTYTGLTGNSYTFNGLSSGVTYTFTITPYNTVGVAGNTASVSGTTVNSVMSHIFLNLDASNYSSGNTWTDTSPYGNSVTLYNCTYSSSNGGTINFNGGSSWAYRSSISGFNSSNWTGVLWIYVTGYSAYNTVFTLNRTGSNLSYNPVWDINRFYDCDVYKGAINGFNGYTNPTYSALGWNQFVFVKDNTTGNFYNNGNFTNTVYANFNASYGSNNFCIGKDYRDNAFFLKGNVAILQLYNFSMSAQDVANNFNTYRSRFGI